MRNRIETVQKWYEIERRDDDFFNLDEVSVPHAVSQKDNPVSRS